MNPLKTKLCHFVMVVIMTWTSSVSGQQQIQLNNPSFEDIPRRGGFSLPTPITGWTDCGRMVFPGESPPDIHPAPEKSWNVSQSAHHGKTYLGLVTRNNNTFEFISQELSSPLEAGKCYEIKASLCTSSKYDSATALNRNKIESFATPIVFEIRGGNSLCDSRNLLARSSPVDHTEWREYVFILAPTESINSIVLAAFYRQEKVEAYNGHILVDHLSSITEIPCDE